MQQINLYQEQFKPQRRSQVGTVLTLVFVVMIGAMAVMAWWQGHRAEQWHVRHAKEQQRQDQLQADLTALQDKVATLQPSALLARKLIDTRHQLDLRKPVLDQVDRLNHQKERIVDSLEALATRPLPQAWLTTIQLTDGGDEMTLSGITLHAERLPQLVETLATQAVFSGRHFSFVRLERRESGGYGFDLSTRRGGDHE
nr:PilN domain-containing protein [uncultured Desulfuromonas sp.]